MVLKQFGYKETNENSKERTIALLLKKYNEAMKGNKKNENRK